MTRSISRREALVIESDEAGEIHGTRDDLWPALWRAQAASRFSGGWTLRSGSQSAASKPAAEVSSTGESMPAMLRELMDLNGASALNRRVRDAVREARKDRRQAAVSEQRQAEGA